MYPKSVKFFRRETKSMKSTMKRKILFWIIFLPISLLSIGCSKSADKIVLSDKFPIIPTPQEIVYGQKELLFKTFFIDATTFPVEAMALTSFLIKNGIGLEKNGLKIKFIEAENNSNLGKEAYQLKIDSIITLSASTANGAFYGVQTLKQIFRNIGNSGVFPEVNINDWPAFKIRGFMHDTGRNFQSVELLKVQIEVLAQYKMNVFHWHLTDNPGWRLESKLYPELQSDQAFTRKKGKFYTQEDFKDILAFCKERHITLIPEFDIPGHTTAFRKAFGIETMKDEKVLPILLDLFDELCGLADENEMPYIHIGTDEVRNSEEYVSDDFILKIMNRVNRHKREVIVWNEGITIAEDSTSINQLWAQFEGREGHRFIDSRSNYINHLDPFAGMARLYFQQPCRQPKGDELALGGVLCAWPDNKIDNERNVLKQNPVYPSIVFYADAIWKGRNKDNKEYWAKLPHPSTPEFSEFKTFEEKVITHRDLFFKGKEFPYVKQTEMQWKVIGPFDHGGNVSKSFPIEGELKESYTIEGQKYRWQDSIVGGTVHFKHFFGFPALTEEKSGTYYAFTEIYSPENRVQDFWIGFHGWSRSSRRGGPTPKIGQWHTTDPKIWVNETEISTPVWKQPDLGVKTSEIPFIDEDYFFREPTKINLHKGRNKVLLKIPKTKDTWKWMFTCVPVNIDGGGVSEVEELKFNTTFENK
jgi:glycosyl hydrolase family 20